MSDKYPLPPDHPAWDKLAELFEQVNEHPFRLALDLLETVDMDELEHFRKHVEAIWIKRQTQQNVPTLKYMHDLKRVIRRHFPHHKIVVSREVDWDTQVGYLLVTIPTRMSVFEGHNKLSRVDEWLIKHKPDYDVHVDLAWIGERDSRGEPKSAIMLDPIKSPDLPIDWDDVMGNA
jgi:hypothetical protein